MVQLLVLLLCLPVMVGLRRRLARTAVQDEYQRQRMLGFTRAYHLLMQSHGKLEQALVSASTSLREVLLALGERLGATDGPLDAALGELILTVLASHGGIQSAALYEVDDAGAAAELKRVPLARLGEPPPLLGVEDEGRRGAPRDPVLAEALRARQLTRMVTDDGVGPRGVALCALPLIDVTGRLWGIVAIYRLPFLAYQPQHMNLLSVLGAHIGDLLAAREGASSRPFQRGVQRCLRDARRHGLPAGLVGIVPGPSARADEVLDVLSHGHRSLDLLQRAEDRAGGPVVYVLLPLTDARGIEGYLGRMDRQVRERCGLGLLDVAAVHPLVLHGPAVSDHKIDALYQRCQNHA